VNGLRGRVAATAVSASAVGLLVVLLLAGPALHGALMEQAQRTLLAEARLMARVVEQPLAAGTPAAQLDRLVDAAAGDVRARVTIVALDGRVLADSSLSGAALDAVENHGGRPEVVEALAAGSGSAERHSGTVGEDLLYVAVAIQHEGHTLGVSRVAWPLTEVRAELNALRRAVALALLAAFAVAVALSTALSASLTRPLRLIMNAARRFGAGDTSARIAATRPDELGELSRILDASAERLEERLADNARDRARSEAILAAMEEGLLAVDHRGIVLAANERLRQSFGLGDTHGRHYVETLRQREVGELVQAVLEGGLRRTAEIDTPHLKRVWSVTAVPFPGPEQAPHGALLTFHDVTERRQLERVRRDFVANASHELRTPLTSIRGFVEALEDGANAEPETAQRFLGKIRTHADRMAALVEDLLELSRLESGERPPRWETVTPAELAEDALASFARQAERRGITLTHLDQGAPSVVSDGERLVRILGNLVDNALKYTPEGGRVDIVTEPGPDGGAWMRVRDDGPGIAPEHVPRLFERFYRVDTARSRDLGGTGLGLSIVRHLADGMGASVGVESRVGAGSCFTVTLPADPRR
jgi:two-component system, OmpR family, phosphate regulon sensor histidine kinase PhoR